MKDKCGRGELSPANEPIEFVDLEINFVGYGLYGDETKTVLLRRVCHCCAFHIDDVSSVRFCKLTLERNSRD